MGPNARSPKPATRKLSALWKRKIKTKLRNWQLTIQAKIKDTSQELDFNTSDIHTTVQVSLVLLTPTEVIPTAWQNLKKALRLKSDQERCMGVIMVRCGKGTSLLQSQELTLLEDGDNMPLQSILQKQQEQLNYPLFPWSTPNRVKETGTISFWRTSKLLQQLLVW